MIRVFTWFLGCAFGLGAQQTPRALPTASVVDAVVDAVVDGPFRSAVGQRRSSPSVEYYADNDAAPIEFAHTSQRCSAPLLSTREQ